MKIFKLKLQRNTPKCTYYIDSDYPSPCTLYWGKNLFEMSSGATLEYFNHLSDFKKKKKLDYIVQYSILMCVYIYIVF